MIHSLSDDFMQEEYKHNSVKAIPVKKGATREGIVL